MKTDDHAAAVLRAADALTKTWEASVDLEEQSLIDTMIAWRAAGRPGAGEDDATEAILGLGNELLATKARESALWACLEALIGLYSETENPVILGYSGDKALESRNLPALCSVLGVEVGE